MQALKDRIVTFCKRETVFVAAAVAAALSSFLIYPSAEYFSYPDYRVLALLFCLMVIVAGVRKQGVFTLLGEKMTGKAKSSRQLSMLLVMLCFFSSMLITNDVALLTFVPFTVELLNLSGCRDKMIRVIVLQTIAANLGSMFTPVGNPQNLYLYGLTDMGLPEFLLFMLPITALSLALLLLGVFLDKKRVIEQVSRASDIQPDKKRVIALGLLFLLCLLTVVRILPWQIMTMVVAAGVLLIDRELFKKVDYCLLGTFLFFFIFVGNMQRIESVKELLEGLLRGREMLLAALASQIISNVPAAMLLSGFTENYRALIYGANIGGLGTLIASLASIISYKLYAASEDADKGKYMAVCTGYNVLFLGILLFAGFLCL